VSSGGSKSINLQANFNEFVELKKKSAEFSRRDLDERMGGGVTEATTEHSRLIYNMYRGDIEGAVNLNLQTLLK
jgi:hypothetical protein